jgi:hypothetical protein
MGKTLTVETLSRDDSGRIQTRRLANQRAKTKNECQIGRNFEEDCMAPDSLDISQRNAALIVGGSYLVVFLLTPHAWIDKLYVQGDAGATFAHFFASESLLRAGIACWLIVLIADTLAGWGLYYFFRPFNSSLSFLALCFRLLFVAVLATNILNWLHILQLLQGSDYLKVLDKSELEAQVTLYYEAYKFGSNVAFVFFGVHIGVVGLLILRSGYVHRMIGALLTLACAGYLINSFCSILSPRYASNETAFWLTVALPAVISEFSLTVWLLVKGGKVWTSRISATNPTSSI